MLTDDEIYLDGDKRGAHHHVILIVVASQYGRTEYTNEAELSAERSRCNGRISPWLHFPKAARGSCSIGLKDHLVCNLIAE